MADETDKAKVVNINTKDAFISPRSRGGGGNSGDGGDEMLEKRVARLEDDVSEMKTDIAGIKARLDSTLPNVATKDGVKAEVEKMGRLVIMWNVGTLIAVAAIVFGILRYLK